MLRLQECGHTNFAYGRVGSCAARRLLVPNLSRTKFPLNGLGSCEATPSAFAVVCSPGSLDRVFQFNLSVCDN